MNRYIRKNRCVSRELAGQQRQKILEKMAHINISLLTNRHHKFRFRFMQLSNRRILNHICVRYNIAALADVVYFENLSAKITKGEALL